MIIGCIHICPLVYLGRSFMSHNRKHAPFLDIVLLIRSFYVVISSVIVLTSPEKLMRFPPATIIVRLGSSFWSL